MIVFILMIIAAYLIGSVPAAYLLARWFRRVDIRTTGSGNAGVSNLIHLTSKRMGLPVIIFDTGKGLLMVLLARLLGLELYQQIIVGLCVVVGHSWPLFLGFNGGRGILALAGVSFALAPWLAAIMLAICLTCGVFKHLALGTLLVVTLQPVLSWFTPQLFDIDRSLTLTLGFAGLLVLTVVRRLAAPRTEFTATVSVGELLLNRLLFDRDIRSREVWINRSLPAED